MIHARRLTVVVIPQIQALRSTLPPVFRFEMHSNRGSRGYRPRPTGGFRRNGPSANVPSSTLVVPGASVSVVLKADQPTGREVQGVVQDLLSRGDHPRGIKVRLADGRVGRVQRMASEVTGNQNDDNLIVTNDPVTASSSVAGLSHIGRGGRAGRGRDRYTDIRNEDTTYIYQPDQPSSSFADYIDAALERQQPRKRPGRSDEPASSSPGPANATCPICGEFEGDEAAVSHHVDSHLS